MHILLKVKFWLFVAAVIVDAAIAIGRTMVA